MFYFIKKNIRKIFLAVILVLICIASAIGIRYISFLYTDHLEYERWRGDSEMEFAQISCFVPLSDKLTTTNVNTFRTSMVKAFKEASLESDNQLFIDCYSFKGSGTVSTDSKNTKAPIYAVSGDFFDFHIMDFTSGTFFSDSETQSDCVVLDENLAWFLFGSTDVVGLTVKIGDYIFYISGVVKVADDFATKKANTDEMFLFMPFGSYSDITGEETYIETYEVVLPDPVKNYAFNLVENKFPAKNAVINNVTDRFSFANLFSVLKNYASRTMSSNVTYPVWENAIRYAESVCSLYLLILILCSVYPLYLLIRIIFIKVKYGINVLDIRYIPKVRDSLEEYIRIRQRARWERRHPGMK